MIVKSSEYNLESWCSYHSTCYEQIFCNFAMLCSTWLCFVFAFFLCVFTWVYSSVFYYIRLVSEVVLFFACMLVLTLYVCLFILCGYFVCVHVHSLIHKYSYCTVFPQHAV